VIFTVFQKIFLLVATSIMDIFLVFVTRPKAQKAVLVVNLATIGDYILFRNFLEYTKKEYNKFKIVLCGNVIWKELSEYCDNPYVDEFIWVDVRKFVNNLLYRFAILKKARACAYSIALHPCYSRSFFGGDQIIKNVVAKEKIGSKCEKSRFSFFKRLMSDRYYTQLINTPEDNIFEFDRYRIFFEDLFRAKLPVNKPQLPLLSLENPVKKKHYVVIVPGAGVKFREWSPNNFAQVVDFIWHNFSLVSVLIGGNDEATIGREVLLHSKTKKVVNLIGKSSLLESARIIQGSNGVISNETGIVHIAVALKKNVLCISNGNHLGRFAPYPSSVYSGVYYIFPDEISENLHRMSELKEKYRYGSDIDINSISPDTVKTKIATLLRGQKLNLPLVKY